ncbi:hypothetical protein [Prevotella brunnea]|nr:hypothetical protein [Prevotella brunnea]
MRKQLVDNLPDFDLLRLGRKAKCLLHLILSSIIVIIITCKS